MSFLSSSIFQLWPMYGRVRTPGGCLHKARYEQLLVVKLGTLLSLVGCLRLAYFARATIVAEREVVLILPGFTSCMMLGLKEHLTGVAAMEDAAHIVKAGTL